MQISLDQIVRGPNDRTVFDEETLVALSESMSKCGLTSPIIVRPVNGAYEIVAGERRFRAASLLCWESIECVVRDLSDDEAYSIMLLENVAREDLNPIDEARAYQVRIDRLGWDEQECARVAGVSAMTVSKRLKLLGLINDVQLMVSTGNLNLGHAELISRLDPNRQLLALRVLTSGRGVTLNEFRTYTSKLLEEHGQEAMFDLTALWIQHVQEPEPKLRGVGAIVNVPSSDRYPIPEVDKRVTSEIIYDYIFKLQEMGYQAEAEAMGVLYKKLILCMALSLPRPKYG